MTKREQRKAQERINRKNDMLDAARRLFSEKGYIATTMDDIAKESEFTKKTVYKYFISKEDIAACLHVDAAIKEQDKYNKAVEIEGTAYEKLLTLAYAIYNCYVDQPFYTVIVNNADLIFGKPEKISRDTQDKMKSNMAFHQALQENLFELGQRDKSLTMPIDYFFTLNYIRSIPQVFMPYIIRKTPEEEIMPMLDIYFHGFKSEKT